MPNIPLKDKHLSLVRVLIALAWADGEISNDEVNYLKDFLFQFDLSGEDWAKIEIYLEDPIPAEEAETLIQDFVMHLGSKKEREEVLGLLQGLMSSDGESHPHEKIFLDRCTAIFQDTGPASALIGRIKGLFRESVLKPDETFRRKEELNDFLNNRILFKVRRVLEREKLSLEADPDALAHASLFAGLLAYVASVHHSLSDAEFAVLKKNLQHHARFDEETIVLIASAVQETAAKDLDPFRMTREFYARSNVQQRQQLLSSLFDIAGTDDDLAHAEVEAVREIARGLKFSHREFIDAKIQYRKRTQKSQNTAER
ncbi:MAG: TerB family tellurite resistance protein [Nitrospiria bacterium]